MDRASLLATIQDGRTPAIKRSLRFAEGHPVGETPFIQCEDSPEFAGLRDAGRKT
jgi:hypothetical protein